MDKKTILEKFNRGYFGGFDVISEAYCSDDMTDAEKVELMYFGANKAKEFTNELGRKLDCLPA